MLPPKYEAGIRARCVHQHLYRTSSQTCASSGSLCGFTVGGSRSNNIHKVQWGCSNEAAPPPPLPSPVPGGICLPADSADLAHSWLENVRGSGAPVSVERRRDGTDFLRWRISEMKKSSAQPAPCAPGSHGPPAYCDSLHFASSWRTLQLTLGQYHFGHCAPFSTPSCVFYYGKKKRVTA